MKKIINFILVLSLLVVSAGVSNAYSASDYARNVNQAITRAELAKILVTGADLEIDSSGENPCADLEEDTWYYDYVMTLVNNNIWGCYGGSFGPNEIVSRAEAAKFFVLVYGFEINTAGAPHFKDVEKDTWYYEYVETLRNEDVILLNSGNFYPAEDFTRNMAMLWTDRI